MLNLHNIVRSAIDSIHPDETVTLYQSTGQSNSAGVVTAEYADAQSVTAQIQSASSEELAQAENVSQNTVIMKFYLYSDAELVPAGIKRPLARTGDMIQRADGTWWLVTAVPEDFSASGWVSVLAALQEIEL